VQARQSPFHDRVGDTIASPAFELSDDPFLVGAPGSRPFDAEGLASRRTQLLAGGVLRTFLHNTYTARQTGFTSTAGAYRTSYRGLPDVAPSNLVVRAGDRTPEELVREAGSGVLLTLIHGTHAVHPHSGAFSVGGSGRLIESGELTHAVREVTVAGTFGDLLSGVVATATDATVVPDRAVVVTPTIAVEGLTTAGA
jgi:PmbA protein